MKIIIATALVEIAVLMPVLVNQYWHEDVFTVMSTLPAIVIGIFALTFAQDSARPSFPRSGEADAAASGVNQSASTTETV